MRNMLIKAAAAAAFAVVGAFAARAAPGKVGF